MTAWRVATIPKWDFVCITRTGARARAEYFAKRPMRYKRNHTSAASVALPSWRIGAEAAFRVFVNFASLGGSSQPGGKPGWPLLELESSHPAMCRNGANPAKWGSGLVLKD